MYASCKGQPHLNALLICKEQILLSLLKLSVQEIAEDVFWL
jgi:hypothetical protein